MAPESAVAQAAMFATQLRTAPPPGLLAGRSGFRAVALCGLGGSAAGGRLAVSLLGDQLAVPVVVVQDTALPGWVGPGTLVCVTSYSGGTIEALDWYEQAGARGATRVAICSGGELGARAAGAGEPAVVVEGGYAPRFALGLLLSALLATLHEAGVVPDPSGLLARAAKGAGALAGDRGGEAARDLAGGLLGRVAVLYGTGPRAAAALRIKNQLNENAKVLAFTGALPEIAHNEVLGWQQLRRGAFRQVAVFLRDPADAAQATELTDAVAESAAADGADVITLSGQGEDEVSRLFWLLALGDFASIALADAEGVDALDIERLTAIKARLAASRLL